MTQQITLQLNDDRSDQTLLFKITPIQQHLLARILGLDFDTATGKVEYFDDRTLEQILANDTYLQNLEKRRSKEDIHDDSNMLII